MPSTTKASLSKELVATLRRLRNAATDAQRTDLLKETARLTVDLREFFLTDSGEPDWAARTWAYRDYLRERYIEAGYPIDEAKTTQAAVRYHVSGYIRTKLASDQVADLGLASGTFNDRKREVRTAQSELLKVALTPPEHASAADESRAIAGALLVLERVNPANFADLSTRQRANVRVVLDKIRDRAGELRDGLGE
ncbi:hypothetical protein AB0H43_03090 [Hamadaea sp. NPDC050747]|uniref:hypothetical protein n=1 Tax=Hamadaea sp. NPDC050747 TaxID=3155789 RepID=UPI0033FB9C36